MFKEKPLKKLLNLSGLLILLIALGIGMVLTGCQGQNGDPAIGTTEPSQPDASESEEKVLLYWNLDRGLYTGESADGAVREKEADGYYHVRFSVDGETVEYKVSGARVMENIDKYDLMGLEFDTDGYVVGVVDVAEITAGEVAVGEYVVIAGDTSITTCPDKSLEGQYTTYQYAANVGIYNVMGQEPVGFVDTPQPVDTIRAFVNDAGEITHIFILTRLNYFAGPSRTAYCPECQQDVVWREWSDTVALPNQDGHWYLAEDIVLENAATLENEINVSVDLNGKTVTASSRRMYVLNSGAELTLIDSVGTGKMVGYRGKAGDPSSTIGGMFYLNKGDGQTLNIYSGTYDGSQLYLESNGGVIAMNENQGTFNMYGGTIIGAGASGNGGAVYASTGSAFNMAGGTITGGHADNKGDNVYIQMGAAFTQTGGTIDEGSVHDGNVLQGEPIYHCLCGSTTDKHIGKCDGTELEWLPWEESGTLPSTSGNYYLNCKVQVTKAATLKNVNVNLDLHGWRVTALDQRIFVVEGNSTLNIVDSVGGARVIGVRTKGSSDGAMLLMNTDSSGSVNLYSGILEASMITDNKQGGVFALRAGSGVFNMYGGGLIGAASSKEGDVAYLNAGTTFNMYNGFLFDCNPDPAAEMVVCQTGAAFNHYGGSITETEPGAERQACLCGSTNGTHIGKCDGTMLTWVAWEGTELPGNSGNYYLTEDMVIENASGHKTVTLSGKTINLDLNGHTITANSQRIYVLNGNAVLNITDTAGGGVIKGLREEGSTTGGMFYLNKDGTGGTTVSLYGGTLDASGISVTGKGAVVAINANQGSFNMYGGKVIGGICASGDAVYLASGTTFNMTGGEITDSNPDGSKLLVVAVEGAVVNQTGGTITENDSGVEPEPTEHIHCLCGVSTDTENPCVICGSVAVTYTAWDGTTTPVSGGNYYLTGDAKATETLFNVEYDVNICLNGHALTAKDKARAVTMTKGNSVVITGGCGTATGGSIRAVQGEAKTGDALFTKKGSLKLYNLIISNTAASVASKGSLIEIGNNSENIGTLVAVNCTLNASPCSKDVTGYALVRVKAGSSVGGTTVAEDTVYVQTEGGWNGFIDQNYTGHSWTDATCTAPKTCSVCNATEGEALGHSYPVDYVKEDSDADKHYHVCTICEEKDDGEGHTWNQEAATETEDKYCTVCNYVGEPRKDHVHVGTKVEAVASTCVTPGHAEYWTCTCGKWFSDAACATEITDKTSVELPLSGHSFTNYVPDGNATCTADGTETAKCDHCDVTDTRTDEGSAGHSWSNDTCTGCNVIRHCLCGSTTQTHLGPCDGTVLIWQPWTDTLMPGTDGNWYLTADMTIQNVDGYKTVTLAGASINLDLRGHTVTANSQRIYVLNKNTALNIMDSVGGGTIKGVRAKSTTTGAMFYLNIDATDGTVLSLYGGTLDASGIVCAANATKGNGAVVAINANQGTFHMYGGTIIGGTCVSGDAVYLASGASFHMYGGEITDSNTTDAEKQLVVAADGAVFTQTGGTITEYVATEPEPEPKEHIHCLCGASVDTEKACSVCGSVAVTYTEWDGTATPATAGNYYLTGDATATATLFNVDYDMNICLNGHALTAADKARTVTLTKGNAVVITGGCGTATGGSICAVQGGVKTGDALFAKKGTLELYNLTVSSKATTAEASGSLVEIGAGTTTNSGTLVAQNCKLIPISGSTSVEGYALVRVTANSTVNGVTQTAAAVWDGETNVWGFTVE